MTARGPAMMETQRRLLISLEPLREARTDLVLLAPGFDDSTEIALTNFFVTEGGRRVAALSFVRTFSIADRAACIQAVCELRIKSLVLVGTGVVLNPTPGLPDLLCVRDHINYSGWNPMIGSEAWYHGPRFLDMAEAYSESVRKKVRQRLRPRSECIYVGCPNVAAIPVEISAQADVAGPWLVPEAIVARYLDIEVLAFVMPRGADWCGDTRAMESVPTADELVRVCNVIREAL